MTLAQWLESVGCFDVCPCKVTIKGTTYEGCDYRQIMNAPEGCRNPGPYTIRALYLLADSLPACYRRTTNLAFTREDDTREWYIAGYSGAIGRTKWERTPHRWEGSLSEEERRARYEPFGSHFTLRPWSEEHDAIDAHDDRPYARVPMTVEYACLEG